MADLAPLSPTDFRQATGCSDEALDRLIAYADLLRKWQARINLVGPGTLPDLWRRHMLDSAQLLPLVPMGTTTLIDLGSGAGFPGAVLSILGVPGVHLLESDARKCVFLREVARITKADFRVLNARIEAAEAFPAEVVTARALASVGDLLDYAAPFREKNTVFLFLKGKNVQTELTESAKKWNMATECVPSLSDPQGVVLKLKGVSRHHGDDRS